MRNRRRLIPAAFLAVPALALAGCGSAGDQGDDVASGDAATDEPTAPTFRIVASTSVYADIAQKIVGDAAVVEAIIDSASLDPHAYEATAQDQLTIQDADLVIMNGGGYDVFMEGLIERAATANVIEAVEYSHDYPGGHEHADDDDHDHDDHDHDDHDDHGHIHGFNEHVWYDPHTIEHLVEAIRDTVADLEPELAEIVVDGADEVIANIASLEDRLSSLEDAHAGATVFFTEPVGGYLAEAGGLIDVTVDGFAEAVEHGQDVSPAVLLAALTALEEDDVDVLVANAQTGGSETERMITEAESLGIPVIEFTETLPDGLEYFGWMDANIDALMDALG
ncbi:metal ABC transporter solute-binding protein, Zn/Mn family [Microbacterium amylolyticum]|uniref:Zinc/manganese transport system substrate-binding protein n=1 Tax=Microbacterium amylolyticum TaxID=936337 RepID=A0ABS4ZI93_9MICO|nr:zinc ABC transporter substrate-binding protein [Microbacterium amylolyticum]MBP2436989.1 zinc/manganese transport system substrate-binding protein [Microbacterium amylolyticum]